MRIIKKTNIDFMSKTKISGIISLIILLSGFSSLVINKGPKLSIDFKGGVMVALDYKEPINIEKLRSSLKNITIAGQSFDLTNAEIKYFGKGLVQDKSNISIRLSDLNDKPDKFLDDFVYKLTKISPENTPNDKFILSLEEVGPKIGAELSSDAFMAIFSALALILIYISARFEFKYAIGAITALAHDILITLGIFSILEYEISLAVIAAFLTIVGYSLNDTIVIFDRIRENVKILKNVPLQLVVNKSINESLSRTIITSLTTFFVVLILFLVGGQVIHTFAFAMIVGVLIGTYSSIFIASPILIKMNSNNK